LARRYRVEYSVTPATAGQPYAVTHSSAIYVFDQAGVARLLIPSFAAENPNIAGTATDLRKLMDNPARWGLVSRMVNFLRNHI
jgi:protein SCO1/2